MADKKISQLTAASTPVAGTEVFPAVQSGATVKATIDDLFNRQANYLSVLGADRAPTTYGNLHIASTSNAAAYNGGTLSFGGKAVATGNQYSFGGFKFMSDPASGTGWDTYATMSLTNADSSISEKFSFKNNGNFTALSGNLVIGTAGKGIDFSANGGDVLTQYDEGTWNVVWTNLTGTPSNTTGRYTRVGRMVFFTYAAGANSISGVGDVAKFSLPFTPGGYASGSMISQTNTNAGSVLIDTSAVAYPNTFSAAFMVFSGVFYI